ncbi:MAG: hypothetical protein QNK20_16505 [Aureibaculum sp.]|nr:hypothetical protein [Aureibaculum sp.]
MESYGTGFGLLPCYGENAQQDWEKQFNGNNYSFGLITSANAKLLPFVTPNVQKLGVDVQAFNLARISISGGVKTTILLTSLNIALIKKQEGANYDRYYFDAVDCLGLVDTGLYEFRLRLGSVAVGFELFTTELFKIESCNPFAVVGDWNNDFNDDFNNSEC